MMNTEVIWGVAPGLELVNAFGVRNVSKVAHD
jgi:hypothetical protein